MHELSLAEALVEMIEEASRNEGFNRVCRVSLDVGRLSGVEPDALRFGFEVAARHTCAEGAELLILVSPGEACCPDCQSLVSIDTFHDECPACGGHGLSITGGQQFQLKELEVV